MEEIQTITNVSDISNRGAHRFIGEDVLSPEQSRPPPNKLYLPTNKETLKVPPFPTEEDKYISRPELGTQNLQYQEQDSLVHSQLSTLFVRHEQGRVRVQQSVQRVQQVQRIGKVLKQDTLQVPALYHARSLKPNLPTHQTVKQHLPANQNIKSNLPAQQTLRPVYLSVPNPSLPDLRLIQSGQIKPEPRKGFRKITKPSKTVIPVTFVEIPPLF